MTGLGIAAEALPLLAGLATLAVVLFLLATWLGRWPLWLAGYSLVVLAVAIAFFFREPARVGERGPDPILAPSYLALYDVHVQRSPVDGVVEARAGAHRIVTYAEEGERVDQYLAGRAP